MRATSRLVATLAAILSLLGVTLTVPAHADPIRDMQAGLLALSLSSQLSSASSGDGYKAGDPYKNQPEPQPQPAPQEKRNRFHNSSNWEWLSESPYVTPGVELHTDTSICSAGFFAHRDSRHYMIWAGHCGEVGTEVYWKNPEGVFVRLGQVVFSETSEYRDVALVDITGTRAPIRPEIQMEDTKPGHAVNGRTYNLNGELVCRLGYRTGLSCGDFDSYDKDSEYFTAYAPADHGDSGGPVFVLTSNKYLLPIGVVSGGWDYRPDQGRFGEIWPLIDTFGLQL